MPSQLELSPLLLFISIFVVILQVLAGGIALSGYYPGGGLSAVTVLGVPGFDSVDL
jgi:hypothetical protein